MSLVERQLSDVWDALRAQRVQRRFALSEIRIRNLRGIHDLRIPFDYPVSVLAGPNGCGKSTVLFACACAYRVPDGNYRDFFPASLFPNFTGGNADIQDRPERTELEFHYLHQDERASMIWRRGKTSRWSRRGGEQPQRQLYLRTLANLTNPSEVRSFLQLSRRNVDLERISEDLLLFAYRVLPRRYRQLSQITANSRDLLFAELEGASQVSYSEFHMSSGERAILRISKDISNLRDALILIDEVEAGLHPYTQQQAMLEFQRIALRNQLQIIVASHSPVVLESVPPEARLFLDRDENTNQVRRLLPYRDILQKALYGQSRDQLSILCEDDVAEGLIRGLLDVLNVKLELRHEDIIIGRDTGQSEFPNHIRTLAKFGKLQDFVFVLDGDSRHLEDRIKQTSMAVQPLFLPGDGSPESWLWTKLQQRRNDYSALLGMTSVDMEQSTRRIDQLVSGSVGSQDARKTAVEAFANELERTVPELARIIAKSEAESGRGEVANLMVQLEEQVSAWRRQ